MFNLTHLLMELHERGIDTNIKVDNDGNEVVQLSSMRTNTHLVSGTGDTTEKAFAEILRKLANREDISFQDDRLSIL